MRPDADYRVIDLDQRTSLLFLTGNHRGFLVDGDLGRRLRDGWHRLTDPELAEWERLEHAGLVSDYNRRVLGAAAFTDGADLAINVNLTNICNLACTYCFADGGDYGRITEAMGHDSIEHIFAFVRDHVTASRSVRLEMFGGEPLANFPVLRQVCERSERFAAEHGVRFVYRISTNLTLLPDGALELFARYPFIVSVSIDGGRAVQDANRPAKGGQGSYDRVIANVAKVRAASDDITLVARMTVAQREPSLTDNVRQLHELNHFDYFQIYPGVFPAETTAPAAARGADGRTHLKLASSSCSGGPAADRRYVNFFLQPGMPEQFRDFLRAYPSLFRDGNRFKGVLEYERTAQMALEGRLALAFCSGGRTYYTHSPDRSISPCHRLVGEESFDVGRGEHGLTRTPGEWRLPVDTHPVCGRCWARYLCGGGCKQENFVATGDINVLNEESCRYQLLLAEEVLRMTARAGDGYRRRDRGRLDDLFVSCGRPVVSSGRAEPAPGGAPRHFRPLTVPAA